MKLNINNIDLIIICVYLVAILLIGILSVRLKKLTGEGYFLAGRGLGWVMVGAALFASNISTIHLVGLSASGFNEGFVWGNFEWMASVTLILLGLVFAPFYFKSRISTLPEFCLCSPSIVLNNTDLPEPEPPTMPRISPL